MKIIDLKENMDYLEKGISYIQDKWASSESMMLYDDCIKNSVVTNSPLPRWYILVDDDKIVGCVGVITNDFISRMDLYPWLCALYIEEEYRGNRYGELLINHVINYTEKIGFHNLYLCTDHIGYYEKYAFRYIGLGYHPWGEESRIYEFNIK